MYCYPHAVQLGTTGKLGGSISLATRGVIKSICIEESIITTRTTGPGRRGFREEEKRKKLITITVCAYGKEFKKTKVVELNRKVNLKDLEIKEDPKTKTVSIKIKNIEKK